MDERNTIPDHFEDLYPDAGEWEGYAAGRPLVLPQSWHCRHVDDDRELAS